MEKGFWSRNQALEDYSDDSDPLSSNTQRVIPYVADRRNSLIFNLKKECAPAVIASLQAALKRAIEVKFQLESMELAAEPLPNKEERRSILFFEAAEGGAGVLRRLLEVPENLAQVAKVALEICHFDPSTGEDLRRSPGAKEDCEAACYDCLMNYGNQMDHEILDRQLIRDILCST